jgi:flagellar motor switch protein FliN
MQAIPNEIITKLGGLQSQIWQTVTLAVSEACGQPITFGSAVTVSSQTSELLEEMAAPMMVIQFTFAGHNENSQVILLPRDTTSQLAALVKGEEVGDIDANIVAELRSLLEGIVQGICLSVGNLKNETVVASGMTLRFQVFSFPPNLGRVEELVRTQVAISAEEVSGVAIWIMDGETARSVLGERAMTEDGSPFPQAAGTGFGTGGGRIQGDDSNSLSLLMDIPLEISVELGRVKMLVKDVVALGAGSIVEIEKLAGEPVDVLVNGRPVARGEVVVIEDNFGVRITEIINPYERINRLGEVA